MNAALMPLAFEAPSAAPPKGAGKPAASQGKDGGEFGAMFAGLVADGQPQSGEGQKPDAESQAAGETVPGLTPGMWNVAALLAQLPPTTMTGQQSTPQPAQDTTGAITPLSAAAVQTAQAAQPLPPPQIAAPAASDAGQQILTDATTQPAEQKVAAPVIQQVPALSDAQPLPARPEIKAMPATMPAAMAPAPTTEAQPVPVPAAVAPAEQPVTAATGQETAAQQQVKPTVVTPAAITAAIAGGQRQPETQTVVETEAEAKPLIATAALKTVAASGEAQTAGDGSAAFTADGFSPAAQNAAPPPETASANQMFAMLVDQAAGRANAVDSTIAAAGNQPTAPQDPHNVAGQIVANARLITQAENSEMVIRLKPEHLGELTLKIVVDSGVVSATFHTANAEVRAAIEASLPQLRQDMANQGLKVDNVGVYTSLDHFFANDQHHAPQQQTPQATRRMNGDETFTDTVATVAAIGAQTVNGGTGIDYRI